MQRTLFDQITATKGDERIPSRPRRAAIVPVRLTEGERDHQAEMIGSNMAGSTSAELTREFEAIRQQRPDIRKPVEHVALSFARDERPLSNDEMARLADEYLKRNGEGPEGQGCVLK